MAKMALLPQGLRSFASALGRSVASHRVRHKKFWDMVESDLSANAAFAISRELFAAAEIEALIPGCGCSATSFITENHAGQRSEFRDQQSAYALLAPGFLTHGDPTNAVSLLELQGYLANTLLRDTDQMSMAHALEIRVPFIDSAVASYVLGLPGEWKVDGKRPKPLLLDALDGMLPEGVWHRPKMGFAVPFQRWMKSTLQPELNDTLSDESRLGSLGLNPRYVSSVWQSFQKHPQHQPWSRPWALYVLARWCEINNIQS